MIEMKPPILQSICRNCLQFRKGLSKFLACLEAFCVGKRIIDRPVEIQHESAAEFVNISEPFTFNTCNCIEVD